MWIRAPRPRPVAGGRRVCVVARGRRRGIGHGTIQQHVAGATLVVLLAVRRSVEVTIGAVVCDNLTS